MRDLSLFAFIAACSVFPTALVLNGESPRELLTSGHFWGSMVLLFAACAAALNKIYSRNLVRKYDGLYVTFWGLVFGALLLGAAASSQGAFAQVADFTPTIVISLLAIGVICSAIPWVVWNSTMKYLDVHVAASFGLLIPIFATMYSLLFFNEPFTPWIFFGLLLTSCGIYLVHGTQKHAPAV